MACFVNSANSGPRILPGISTQVREWNNFIILTVIEPKITDAIYFLGSVIAKLEVAQFHGLRLRSWVISRIQNPDPPFTRRRV